jgi:serine phosphatase RsbU (regulator of sigma subunit)
MLVNVPRLVTAYYMEVAAMRGQRESAESLAQRIVEAVQRFSGIDAQTDDLSLMVIRCT